MSAWNHKYRNKDHYKVKNLLFVGYTSLKKINHASVTELFEQHRLLYLL
jgi:hypothetical protein